MTRRLAPLVLVVLALGLVALQRRLPSLEEQTVLSLPPPTCATFKPDPSGPEITPRYLVEKSEPVGAPWAEIKWGARKNLGPGDCLAFALLETPGFRACCAATWTSPGGETESARACSAAAERGPIERCNRIFRLGGRQYSARRVAEWNTANGG